MAYVYRGRKYKSLYSAEQAKAARSTPATKANRRPNKRTKKR